MNGRLLMDRLQHLEEAHAFDKFPVESTSIIL